MENKTNMHSIADNIVEGEANVAVSETILRFAGTSGNSEILARQQMLDEAFDGMTMEAILEHLEKSRDSFGKQRSRQHVAWSLQRYLIFAILSCVPGMWYKPCCSYC